MGGPRGPVVVSHDRLHFLDGARALAALLVVLVHVRATVPRLDLPRPVGLLFDLGHYAVTVFIVISGFSLGLGWARRNGEAGWVREFLYRRFWRIVPTYWAALALSVVLIVTVLGDRTGTHWDTVLPLDWSGVAVHAALMQDVLPGRPPNHVLWSIAIEWHIYFLFPVILALALARRPVLNVAAAVVAVYAVWALGWTTGLDVTIQYVACFAVGVLAATLTERLWLLAIGGTAVAAAFTLGLWLLPGHLPAMNALADLPLATATAGVLSLMRAGRLPSLARLLGAPPLAALGVMAYSVYLVHAPALQLVWQYGLRPFDLSRAAEFGLLLTVGTVLALAASWVFFVGVERRFLGRPPQLAHRPPVEAPLTLP